MTAAPAVAPCLGPAVARRFPPVLDRTGELVEPKRHSVRDVVLMPALGKLLRDHKAASPFSQYGDFVFTTGTGRPLGWSNVIRWGLNKALEGAQINGEPKVRFHDLHHTFASLLIAQGADVVFVSRQLGHKKPDITLRVYAHLFDQAAHAEDAQGVGGFLW